MPAQYAVPANWGGPLYHDLELPSGSVIQVKQIDLDIIIKAGMVDEFDSLTEIVDEKVVQPARGKAAPQDRQPKKLTKKQLAAKESEDLKKFFKSDNLTVVMTLMARLLPHVVIQPPVESALIQDDGGKWSPIDPQDREDGVIYTDTIPLPDQMTIFNFVMKGMDMEGIKQFRDESESPVADVEAQPVREDPPL